MSSATTIAAALVAGLGPPGGAPPKPRRHRRGRFVGRRRRHRRWRNRGPYVILPVGARVYACIERQENDPNGMRRWRWGWCEVIATKPKSAPVTLRPEVAAAGSTQSDDIRADARGCYIRSSYGRWMTLWMASYRKHPTLWWFHDVEVRSFRPATELEVAFYAEGFVPHEQWRLMSGVSDSNQTFVELTKPERVWLARPEPPTDEEIADAKEKKRTKKRASALTHAQNMLTMWERSESIATKRVGKWKAAVRRLEKPR